MKRIVLYFFAAILLVPFTSCDDDEDKIPDFVGTWSSVRVESGAPISDELVLSTTDYNELIKMMTAGGLKDFIGMEGDLTYSGNTITLTHTKLGMAEIDTETGPVGDIVWAEKGTPEFDGLAVVLKGSVITAEYQVVDDKLTLNMSFENGDKAEYVYSRK